MAYPPITSLGTVPQRTQTPAEFATNADSFLGALPNFRTELNTFGAYVDTKGAEVDVDAAAAASSALQSADYAADSQASAVLALSYKDLAAGTANFKGLWSALTGSLAVPASVYHNGLTWVLLSSLANVTTAEPGVSASWVVASGESFSRLVDGLFARATLDLNFARNNHKVYELYGLEPKQLQSAVVTGRNSTATYQSPTGLSTIPINTPRISYDAATGDSLGLLVEEARTNLLLHSQYTAASGETPPTGWTATQDTGVTTTAASSRFAGAITLAATGASQREIISQVVTLAASTTYTFSCYFSQGTSANDVVLRVITSDTPTGTLTLAGSAVTSASTYSITFTTVAGGTYTMYVGLGCSGNATGTVIHETPQLEVGASATSYIPTTAAQVTRLGDQCTATTPAMTEGTIVCIASGQAPTSGINRSAFILSDGTSSNQVIVRRNESTLGSGFVVVSSGSVVAQAFSTAKASGKKNRFAISWTANKFLGAEDGRIVLNDSSGNVPTGMTKLGIGSGGSPFSGAEALNGFVERIVFIPHALTEAELQAITA